jgi:hypothetical protein
MSRRLDILQLLFNDERLNALFSAGTPPGVNGSALLSYAGALRLGLLSPPTGTTSQGTPVTNICSMNPSSSAFQQGVVATPSVGLGNTGTTSHQTDQPGAVRKRIDDAFVEQDATKDIIDNSGGQ